MSMKTAVFISGALHRREPHQYRNTNLLLARALNESKLPMRGILVPNDGYPKDPTILDIADVIVVFSTGHTNHPLVQRLADFEEVMKRGVGLVLLHWSTEPAAPLYATAASTKRHPSEDKFLEWMGGYCDPTWSVNPHWTPSFKPVAHSIWNGVKEFTTRDEWYYHMRFRENLEGVTPILSALPPTSTLRRKDGPREGNPEVRAAVARGETQHVAWAYQRPNGGRGFGWTGAHYFTNWQQREYRTIMLNAIVWAAHLEVPANGVPSDEPQTGVRRSENVGARPPQSIPVQLMGSSTVSSTPPRVLVVGASRGIGLELARVYDESGAIVNGTARNAAPELRAALRDGAFLELDVRNQSQVDALGRRLQTQQASIDLLIHSAGVKVGPEADVMDINGEAPFRLISALLPSVLRSQRRQIVIVTSDRGQSRFQSEVKRNRCSGDPNCLYTRSKMLAHTKFRELEPTWKQQGITAVCVHPGRTKTDMSPTAKQTARFSATSMRKLFERLKPDDSGKLFNFDGKVLRW